MTRGAAMRPADNPNRAPAPKFDPKKSETFPPLPELKALRGRERAQDGRRQTEKRRSRHPSAIRSHRIAAAEPSPEIAVRPAKPGRIAAHRSGAPRQVK